MTCPTLQFRLKVIKIFTKCIFVVSHTESKHGDVAVEPPAPPERPANYKSRPPRFHRRPRTHREFYGVSVLLIGLTLAEFGL